MLTLQELERVPRAYRIGYLYGFENRRRPYEFDFSIATINWDEYEEGRKAGENDRQQVLKEIREEAISDGRRKPASPVA